MMLLIIIIIIITVVVIAVELTRIIKRYKIQLRVRKRKLISLTLNEFHEWMMFEVNTTVKIHIKVFWVVIPYSQDDGYQPFGHEYIPPPYSGQKLIRVSRLQEKSVQVQVLTGYLYPQPWPARNEITAPLVCLASRYSKMICVINIIQWYERCILNYLKWFYEASILRVVE
jgi:hypothetical protein